MAHKLGNVFLKRTFELWNDDSTSQLVQLRLGQPFRDTQADSQDNNQTEWRCPFQIVGLGTPTIIAMRGVDPLEALFKSLQVAEIVLMQDAKRLGYRLTWQGNTDLGFHRLPYKEPDKTDIDSEDTPFFETAFNEFFDKFAKQRK